MSLRTPRARTAPIIDAREPRGYGSQRRRFFLWRELGPDHLQLAVYRDRGGGDR